MAGPAAQFRPGRYLAVFIALIAVLYALVLFTPGSKTPKLGIDLQGGTSITITAQTTNGSSPTNAQMQQARTIMQNRVNGSGVAGAQVQIQSTNQLVITVPGKNTDLGELTRAARLNMRPEFGCLITQPSTGYNCSQGTDYSQLISSSAATASSTGPSGSAPRGSAGATTAAAATTTTTEQLTTAPAIGDTTTPSASSATGGATPGPTSATGAKAGNPSTSGQGLRAPAAATVGASPSAVTITNTSGSTGSAVALGTTAGSTTGTSAPTTPSSAAGSGSSTTGSGAASTGTAKTSTGAAAASSLATISGADPKNPTQPAGTNKTAWATWETAVQTALTNGTVKCADVATFNGLDDPTKPLIACGSAASGYGSTVFLLDATLVSGNQIDSAAAVLSQNGAGYVINLNFKSQGFSTWSNYTANHNVNTVASGSSSYVDFTLDGEVISPTQIQETITTPVTQISGNFNQTSATQLANALNFGALPLAFTTGTSTQVSAELGSQYLSAGLIAGGIGLLLVILYCLIYYRLLGLVTILSLALSGAMVFSIMTLLGRWINLSLDVAGIAGLIVAIGITADSFVIYFERLKDEVREGRSFRSAVPRAWQRAIRTILSADAISILSSVILYIIAVGDVKGFAFTLGLSTVLDLVIVFLVTHPLVALASRSRAFQSARYSGLGATARAGAEHRASTSQFLTKEA